MQRWQVALHLSEQDLQELSELPFGKLLFNLQNRNLNGIFEALERVNAQLHERL